MVTINKDGHVIISLDDLSYDLNVSKAVSYTHLDVYKRQAQWKETLGDDWERIHEEWRHKMANLTVTAYNSDYSLSLIHIYYDEYCQSVFGERIDKALKPLATSLKGLRNQASWDPEIAETVSYTHLAQYHPSHLRPSPSKRDPSPFHPSAKTRPIGSSEAAKVSAAACAAWENIVSPVSYTHLHTNYRSL